MRLKRNCSKRKSVIFLALSGVRIREPELLALGMTLPGFIERGKTIAQLPSLGLLTLAGLTPPDWDTSYREFDQFSDADIAAIAEWDYSLVAISALTARIFDAYRISDELRAKGKTVVLGGLHVTALPHEALQHADAVVVGEGEVVWARLLKDFLKGQLQCIYRATTQFNFAEAPLPRYDLLDPALYNRITLQTTRGCPLDCEFCGASRLISRFKHKPLDLVRRDLEHVLSFWPRPFIELADDNTFVNKVWSRELAQLFGQYPVRWFTETDISVADDPALLELLAGSGLTQLLIGLESASPESLSNVDSRDWKLRRRDRYMESIDCIQSHGISVNGCFTLGLDADTTDIFEETLEFVQASGLSEVQITILTPFPGTELYRRLYSEGRLMRPEAWDYCTLFDVIYQPAGMSVQELEQGFLWLMKELYSDAATRQRKQLFSRTIRRKFTAGETTNWAGETQQ